MNYEQYITKAETTCGVTSAERPHEIIGALAQMLAEKQSDTERLLALIDKLNTDSREIGAGMMAELKLTAKFLRP